MLIIVPIKDLLSACSLYSGTEIIPKLIVEAYNNKITMNDAFMNYVIYNELDTLTVGHVYGQYGNVWSEIKTRLDVLIPYNKPVISIYKYYHGTLYLKAGEQ